MSCSFWNMRRRLRQQLGVEREIAEEKVVADIATAQKEAKEAEKEPAKKQETATKKRGAK